MEEAKDIPHNQRGSRPRGHRGHQRGAEGQGKGGQGQVRGHRGGYGQGRGGQGRGEYRGHGGEQGRGGHGGGQGRGGRGGGQGRGGHGGSGGGQQIRDKHARRHNNRGGHGYGGKAYDRPFNDKDYEGQRPMTSYGAHKPNYKKNYNYYEQRPYRQQSAKNRPINAPKDSYYYKYFYGPYPEIKEIEVTLESEVPIIKEEDLLVLPSEEEYAAHMKE